MKTEQATESESKECIVKLRQLSPEEQRRAEAWYYEKRIHDEASALGSARREGFAIGFARGFVEGRVKSQQNIIANMKRNDFTDEEIQRAIGSLSFGIDSAEMKQLIKKAMQEYGFTNEYIQIALNAYLDEDDEM